MRLMTLAKGSVEPLDATWCWNSVFGFNLYHTILFSFVLATTSFLLFIGQSEPMVWVVSIIFLLFAGTFFLPMCAPFALTWFLRRPETKAYFRDVLASAQDASPSFDRSKEIRYVANLFSYVNDQTKWTGAVALTLTNEQGWNQSVGAACHIFYRHPETQRLYHLETPVDIKMRTSNLSLLTRALCCVSAFSINSRNAAPVFPLQGYLGGTAHEAMQWLSSIQAHKDALAPANPLPLREAAAQALPNTSPT